MSSAESVGSLKKVFSGLKHLQKVLKHPEAANQMHGGGAYEFVKYYLDMIYDTDSKLKHEQSDLLSRLFQINKDELNDNILAQNEAQNKENERILAASEDDVAHSTEVASEAERARQEADSKCAAAKNEAEIARKEAEDAAKNRQLTQQNISLQTAETQRANDERRRLFDELQKKEMVSLEEKEEAAEIQQVVQDVAALHPSGEMLQKTDDILF